MAMNVRKNPFVCLLLSLGRVLIGRLIYSNDYVGTTLKIENGEVYRIFRHIKSVPQSHDKQGSVFIVNFKFARLSQKTNRFVSQLPMLLITGFPGFRVKMYAVNHENGYWLGIYQWESKHALDAYKQSLVLRLMNSRAREGSVTYQELDHYRLTDYIEEHKIHETHSSSNNKDQGDKL
jgi:hypothetical protein